MQTKKIELFYNDTSHIRIDKYLSSLDIDELLSRSFIDKLIDLGLITVNGENCKKNHKLKFSDKIKISIPQKENITLQPLKLDLNILYEDEYLVILDKPWGLTVHPAPGHPNDTLVNALIYHFGKNLSAGSDNLRPGIVHRLDKDTSGLMIIAKDDKTHIMLSTLFQERKIEKYYKAISANTPTKIEGTIQTYLNRDKKDRKKFAVSESGKYAITHYKIIKNYEYFSLLDIKLETGRTHQIRIHLSHINCPILGDDTYSSFKRISSYIPSNYHKRLKSLLQNHLTRQALHSYRLAFTHPITKEKINVVSELPSDMKYAMKWIEDNFGE